MSSLAFSPSFIWTTPSSQPATVSLHSIERRRGSKRTLDDAANANGGLEWPAARLLSCVELLALAVLLAGLLEPARVQHGDGVALLGGRAVALDKNGLGDAHGAC